MTPPARNVEGGRVGEFELIERYFAPGGRAAGRPPADVGLGIGDDAALVRVPPDMDLVVAVDTLVAGRHFPAESGARSIGHRALAVNLSDIAAMGATPRWATLALTLPSADDRWLAPFARGFFDLAAAHDVALIGGDTTAGPLTLSVQILGLVEQGTALLRSGARAGDVLAVTGTLGDAGAGLALVTGALRSSEVAAQELVRRFEYPEPRVAFGKAARALATAAMDISDGLAGDLATLAAASRLAAQVAVERLPISTALRSAATVAQARDWALAAGDDYELLVTVAPQRFDDLADVARGLNLTLTSIGEMRPGSGVRWTLGGNDFDAPARGYDHFP